MKTIRVIACLDVKDGVVVKGVQFVNLRSFSRPAEMAEAYMHEGADEIVFLDIAATVERQSTLLESVRETAERLFVPLTVGGGVRSLDDARVLLRAGADKVAVNSAALKNPKLITEIAQEFGSQCAVVAIDVSHDQDDNLSVVSHAGTTQTHRNVFEWASEAEQCGAGELLVTAKYRDGTMNGYDTLLLQKLRERVSIPIVASGGAGNAKHAVDAVNAGADAVLFASVLHDRRMSIAEIKEAIAESGNATRPVAQPV